MIVLSVGEVLWDVFGEREFLGGAPLNFSVSMQRLGSRAALLSAVGFDERGRRACAAMEAMGLVTDFLQRVDVCTATAIVTTDISGNGKFVIARPAAFDLVELSDSALGEIRRMRPEWIYFGTLAQTMVQGEDRLTRLLAAVPDARCFYDINLRHGHWNAALVQRLSRRASIVKLNHTEAETLFELTGLSGPFSVESFCRFWSKTQGNKIICVTMGDNGCAVWQRGTVQRFPGYPVSVVDTVGAGDVFSAAFLHGYTSGWSMEKASSFANALGAIVASRSGATPLWTVEEGIRLLSTSNCLSSA